MVKISIWSLKKKRIKFTAGDGGIVVKQIQKVDSIPGRNKSIIPYQTKFGHLIIAKRVLGRNVVSINTPTTLKMRTII